jgi:hypothetical protein
MSGVLDTFRTRVPVLAAHVETQLTLRAELRSQAESSYAAGLGEFDEATRNGSLLSGEILARWQDFTGTGDLLKMLQVRRGGKAAGRQRKRRIPVRAKALKDALRAGLETLVAAIADRAAEETVAAWQRGPAGAALVSAFAEAAARQPEGFTLAALDFIPSAKAAAAASEEPEPRGVAALSRSSPDLTQRSARVISAWQDHLMQLVRDQNVTKRSVARVVSFDEESLALVLTIGMLGYGSGDVAVTEGASAVPQRLLTSLFGAGPMRDLGARARTDLHEKVKLLFDEETQRFAQIIDATGAPIDTAAVQLDQAVYALEAAR